MEGADEVKEQTGLIGKRIGKLTVVGDSGLRKSRYILWRRRCDCGREILLDTRCLQRGTVRDCGCVSKVKRGQRDLTGQRFGKLVCLEPTEQRGPSGGVVWRCHCDCGNDCLAVSTQLTSGYKKSCGCLGQPPREDLIGKRFGSLEVVSYAGRRNGNAYWHCRCLCGCGRELDVEQSALQEGHTTDCGPLDRNKPEDLTGRRFGSLVVTGCAGRNGGQRQWNCRCDCGNETVVSQANLQSGHTKSCGCLQREIHRSNLKLVEGTSVAIIENRMKSTIASNTSGCNGVYYQEKSGKWAAQITFKRKTYYLGAYPTMEEAVKARKRGEEMYEEFLNWYYNDYMKTERSKKMAGGGELTAEKKSCVG